MTARARRFRSTAATENYATISERYGGGLRAASSFVTPLYAKYFPLQSRCAHPTLAATATGNAHRDVAAHYLVLAPTLARRARRDGHKPSGPRLGTGGRLSHPATAARERLATWR